MIPITCILSDMHFPKNVVLVTKLGAELKFNITLFC